MGSRVVGLVTRGRTELSSLLPPSLVPGTRHPCSVLNGSLQHVICQMISSTCMVACREESVSRCQYSGVCRG